MKRRAGIISVALIIAVMSVYMTGCFRNIIYHEVSPQRAVKIAKDYVSDNSNEVITNFDNPKVEEVVFDEEPVIAFFSDYRNVVGKTLYKVTFNTENDSLLGPITIYVDKGSGVLIGADYRF